MKRLLTIVLTTVASIPPPQAHGQSAGLVSSVVSKIQRNHETLKTLRASISMAKYDARLREEDKYYGAVLYMPGVVARNAFVRLEWSKPQHEILAVANGKYTLYRERLNTVYVGSAGRGAGQDSEIFSMLSMSTNELQNKFQPFEDVREETLWGGVSTTHLKLVPIKALSFKYAEVWVDSTGMPVQTKIVEKNDDATTVRLNNVEKNARLSVTDFAVKYDPSAKIIKG
jgi:outer membrane lipoprotein-sorting protein